MPFRSLRSSTSRKCLVILAVLAFLVQVISITLSWYSQRKIDNTLKAEALQISSNYEIDKTSVSRADILRYIRELGHLDNSGEFHLLVGIVKGSTPQMFKNISIHNRDSNLVMHEEKVTLVTQSSLYNIKHLPELARRWQGPLSIAVFLLNEEVDAAVDFIILLRKCFPPIDANVTFSLILPKNFTNSLPPTSLRDHIPCDQILKYLSDFERPNYEFSGISYPNNLLRNVARRAVETRFILVVDIDMLPSHGVQFSFMNYIRTVTSSLSNNRSALEEHKTVWVLPAYEIQIGTSIPEDKASLLSLKEKGKARPFYQELCWKCQKYTDYDMWESHSVSHTANGFVKVGPLYEVLWKDPWEPFYIAKADVPYYDERFRQYGFNRISQVCELHVAGFRFAVLDSAFLVHRGFKRRRSFHPSKDKEQEANRILFRKFKEDLKDKYPESSRRCY